MANQLTLTISYIINLLASYMATCNHDILATICLSLKSNTVELAHCKNGELGYTLGREFNKNQNRKVFYALCTPMGVYTTPFHSSWVSQTH